jgi:cholesterol oxidase
MSKCWPVMSWGRPARSPSVDRVKDDQHDYDWIVIGSGFGGSVCALRLAEKGYRVAVLEQGRRYADHDFARSASDARRMLWAPRLGLSGIMRISTFRHVSVLSGVGVGGGSLVYANTLYQPHSDDFYRHPQWAGLADWRAVLAPHYDTARTMLGVVPFEGTGPSEALMDGLAADLGAAAQPTPVGIFFGRPGEEVDDPYFGGEGPPRTGCVRCGQCMLGCRYGAKNTLVKNYLWLAETRGAVVLPERKVVDVGPLRSGGFTVTSVRPGFIDRSRERLTARRVIFAGGTLGTNQLLRRCKDSGSLPLISDRLGELVRTNSEAIPAATANGRDADYRSDIAITRSVFLDEHTHVTNNTYGDGGNAFALTFGPLTAGGGWRRRLQYVARLPHHLLRGRTSTWSRRSVIFTVMQSTETSLRLRPGRWPGRRLRTEVDGGHPVASYLPLANQVAELAAARMGGYAQTSTTESLLGAPTSAHFLGGAVIGADPMTGVVDQQHRLFGHPDLLVCDGSAVPANLGVNPSLTITAMAEAAMSHVPPRPGACQTTNLGAAAQRGSRL